MKKSIQRICTSIALAVVLLCGGASGAADDAAEVFAALEKALLKSYYVRVEFAISSEGAIKSSVEGTLFLARSNRARLDVFGTFMGRPVSLRLVSDGKKMKGGSVSNSLPGAPEPFESETPDALHEAIVIGLTRMGLLHNIAVLVGNKPPDRSDGTVKEWVRCSNFQGEDPLAFDIAVSGKHVAEGRLWLDGASGLPARREQTVHFGEAVMEAAESYGIFEVGCEIDADLFTWDGPGLPPPPKEIVESFGLDPFYRKYLDAGGLPVVASEKVSDFALREAAYLIGQVLQNRGDVLKALAQNKTRFVVMAHDELTTMIPEHSDMEPAGFWDKRARGLGATPARPAVSCGEENLLGYPGDPYEKENILIHEFSHAIHHMGLAAVDEEFDGRLDALYGQAMAKGLWKGKYAANNRAEYWAEGVQSWFDTNRPPDHDHNHVDTREELEVYDPGLAALIADVLGDIEWRYTKPADRDEPGHLAGYDHSRAPRFAWPPELVEWYRKYEADRNKKK